MVNVLSSLPTWVRNNKFFAKDLSDPKNPMVQVGPMAANLLSSFSHTGPDGAMHYPVLDIDMGVKVIDSTTKGHHHLFIDKQLTVSEYDKLLRVLVEVGIVQAGVLELQWEQDGHTAVRMPHVKKVASDSSSGGKKVGTQTVTLPKDQPVVEDVITTDKIKVGTVSDEKVTAKSLLNQINDGAVTIDYAQNNLHFATGGMVNANPNNVFLSSGGGWKDVGYTTEGVNIFNKPEEKVLEVSPNKFQGLPDLTPDADAAMIIFKHLADVSLQASESMIDVVDAWGKFLDNMGKLANEQSPVFK